MAMLIRDAIDDYLIGLEARAASKSTVKLYGFMLRRVAGFAERRGRARIDQLTLDVVRGAIAESIGDAQDDEARDAHSPTWKGGERTAYAMLNGVPSLQRRAALRWRLRDRLQRNSATSRA